MITGGFVVKGAAEEIFYNPFFVPLQQEEQIIHYTEL